MQSNKFMKERSKRKEVEEERKKEKKTWKCRKLL